MTRFAFLDDAGVSSGDSRFVVAGAIVHRDRHSATLEDRLFAIAKEVRPDKPNIVLHASDLWHGSRDFDGSLYAQSLRRGAVEKVARLPTEFGLPIAFGQCVRATLPAPTPPPDGTPRKDEKELLEARPHIIAQFECSLRIESWMREHAKDEVAQLVHEDIPRSKKSLRQFHNWARDPAIGRAMIPKVGPYTHIKGPIYYADKFEERLLQIADTCAFVITRHLNGHEDIKSVFEILRPQILDWKAASAGQTWRDS